MKFLAFVRGLVLLLARIGLGGVLIAHGYQRWQVLGPQSQIDYLTRSGIPQPQLFAYGSIVLELVGGLFLVVGLLTPIVAAAVVAEQVLIVIWTNWHRGVYLINGTGQYVGGYEYAVVTGVLALVFVAYGAGPAAVDRLFRRTRTHEIDDDEPDGSTPPARAASRVEVNA